MVQIQALQGLPWPPHVAHSWEQEHSDPLYSSARKGPGCPSTCTTTHGKHGRIALLFPAMSVVPEHSQREVLVKPKGPREEGPGDRATRATAFTHQRAATGRRGRARLGRERELVMVWGGRSPRCPSTGRLSSGGREATSSRDVHAV